MPTRVSRDGPRRSRRRRPPASASRSSSCCLRRWNGGCATGGRYTGDVCRRVAERHESVFRSACDSPATMPTLATRGTQRSVDFRARLLVLAESPQALELAVAGFRVLAPGVDPNSDFLLWLTL